MDSIGQSQRPPDAILDALTAPTQRPSRLLEVSHVAHRLSVSLEQVRRYIRAGLLPAVQLPMNGPLRVHERDLDDFIRALPARQPATTRNNTHRAA